MDSVIIWKIGGFWYIAVLGDDDIRYRFLGDTSDEQFEHVEKLAQDMADGGGDDESWLEDALYEHLELEHQPQPDWYSRLLFQDREKLLYGDADDPAVYTAEEEDLLEEICEAGEALLDIL